MPRIQYERINIQRKGLALIEQINAIISDYEEAGYTLTLRQVYYQLVSRNLIPNTEGSYKNIGNLIGSGRLAGLIDWNSIEDRTRKHRTLSHWNTPAEIVQGAANQYHRDLWEGQKKYVETWVEKDALIGIVEQAAFRLDCPCFPCRGYASHSALWAAALRFKEKEGRKCVIIYLGDHDPSGLNMPNDIKKKMALFGATVDVQRITLPMQQIQEYDPPPNTAKESDTRAAAYIAKYGSHAWELDALKPEVLDALITAAGSATNRTRNEKSGRGDSGNNQQHSACREALERLPQFRCR
jgi:hypothetical protein